MHLYFSGIGGTAIGPLALIAQQAGFSISGSDKQPSQYIDYLRQHGLTDIHIGQSQAQIAAVHRKQPIDWFVYTSALPLEQPDAPELQFCREQGIKTSKRAELLNFILQERHLKLVAVAGTHGKTTTTAMLIWLFKALHRPLSHSVGAKLPFSDMGHYDPASTYFAYEADEFDRNFLAFEPYLSVITGVSWDHHEQFPRREDYQAAFREFMSQSREVIVWQEDAAYLELATPSPARFIQDSSEPAINQLQLLGRYNRLNAWLAIQAVHKLTNTSVTELTGFMNRFPGLQRRMEQIVPNLYSDYAHTPEKIRGCMSVALELAAQHDQAVVVVYEPLTNRRQHYMLNDYDDCFAGASKVYWLPSYLAREDPKQRVIPASELITHLADPTIAEPATMNDALKQRIQQHLDHGDLVVGMAGGGGGSLDEWLRATF